MLNLIDLVNEFVSVMVTLVVVDVVDVVVVVVVVVGADDGADLNDVAKVFENFHWTGHWQHKQQPLRPLLHFVVAGAVDVLGRVDDVVVDDFVHCQLLYSMMMAQCQLEASVLHLLAKNCRLNDKAILVKIVC